VSEPARAYLVLWLNGEPGPGAVVMDAGIYGNPTPPSSTRRRLLVGVQQGETELDAQRKALAYIEKNMPGLLGCSTLALQAKGLKPKPSDGSSATLAERINSRRI
jgi:hypothetical protein